MINKDRIIPITKSDYLSIIATVCKMAGIDVHALSVVDGVVEIPDTSAEAYLANEPVKVIKPLGSQSCYFVPDYDYKGIEVDGEIVEPESGSAEVNPDGVSVYLLTYESSALMVFAVTPQAE